MVNKENSRKINFRPKERILKYLIENKTPISIRKTSSETDINYKNAYNLIRDLEKGGAIIREAIGNTYPIQVDLSSHPEIINVENKRTKEFLIKHPKINLIRQDIEEIGYPFIIVLIFGSYVKNKETASSDIDICIISDNKQEKEKLIKRLGLLSMKIELQDFTTKEFTSMIEKNQSNLGHEIVKNNIILFGIENYYNLITKWMKKK